MFGMGCFWGAERVFWEAAGVYTTAVGYAGGHTHNPTYEEVCTGRTGHAEVVLVVFDPAAPRTSHLLKIFWENHDRPQDMRQGNDIGTRVPLRHLLVLGVAARGGGTLARGLFERALSSRHLGEITSRDRARRRSSTTRRTTTSSTSRRTRVGIANWGTGVSCPVGIAAADGR